MTIVLNVAKEHEVYEFVHHDFLLVAYDELGRALKRLRSEIQTKVLASTVDKKRYTYYRLLIPNLECQFARMVDEGLACGSIKIINASDIGEERKVA